MSNNFSVKKPLVVSNHEIPMDVKVNNILMKTQQILFNNTETTINNFMNTKTDDDKQLAYEWLCKKCNKELKKENVIYYIAIKLFSKSTIMQEKTIEFLKHDNIPKELLLHLSKKL